MRILVVTPYLPHPQVTHGGGQAVRGQLRALASRHDCLVVSLLRPGEADLVPAAAAQGFALRTVPYLDRGATGASRLRLAGERTLAAVRAGWDRYPFYAAKYRSRMLTRTVLAASAEFRPDVVQVEYMQLAYLLRDLRRARTGAPGPRLVLSSHEVGSLPRRRRATAARWPLRRWLLAVAAVWDRLARDASTWADVTLCVTDQDSALLAAVGGRNLVTVPLGIDLPAATAPPAAPPPQRILFLGSFQHPPNRSAAALLCDRIWPAVAAQLPGWQLVLAGAGSSEFLAQRQPVAPGITALGFVPDLTALLRSCRLLAAPLSEGGGIKIKILEAMAHGLPVVTTPIGAEGIVDRRQELVWWADDATAFARQLVAAASDPQGAADRAARARRHVESRFGWEAVVEQLEAVYRGEASGV